MTTITDHQPPDARRHDSPTRTPGTATLVGALASAGAGLVHAAAAGSHGGETTLMWLFACTAAVQVAWAAVVLLRPGRVVVWLGALLNGAAVLAWVASRTVGLAGPLRELEPVGTQDLLAAVLGAVAVGGALLALRPSTSRRPSTSPRPSSAWAAGLASVLVLALAIPAMAAEHTHGASHDHAHGPDEATSPHVHDATSGPIVSLDDPRLTAQQRHDAEQLLDTTRAALARFPDEAAVVAAGYRSIGDGRRAGGFEHFVDPAYLHDGHELDPARMESIVMQRQPDGTKTVVSAMYVLEPGKTMADAPDIAGELTPWHDHENLCFDQTGRLAGLLQDGRCVPGGTLGVTPPMIHVWADDTPCGPFTAIEGHDGGSCGHTHTS